MSKTLETLATESRTLANDLFGNEALICREQVASPCKTCLGFGHIDDANFGKPTSDQDQPKCTDCGGKGKVYGDSCIMKEEYRPLTASEKARGWERRPFWAYDTARLCSACLAYYYAERAAQVLHEQHCI